MGTRSLTIIEDEGGQTLATLYRQSDGYPTGHGAELKEYLHGLIIVDGIRSCTPVKAANGMGCLAAQLVAYFKEGIGSFYLAPTGSSYEEYLYIVRWTGENLPVALAVYATSGENKTVLYDGPIEGFHPEQIEEGD